MRRLAPRRALSPRIARALLPGLAAVAAAVALPRACAAADDGSHLLDSALEMMNLKAEPGPMPDFVQRSRHDPSQDSYIPAGATPAQRDVKLKTPAEVKALTAELDAARAAQVAGRRPKLPSPTAGGPKGAKAGKPLDLAHKAQTATNH